MVPAMIIFTFKVYIITFLICWRHIMSRLERHVPPKRKVNDWLIKHGFNVTSQGGEDGVIEQIFKLLDESESPKPAKRWCVEFGAWDGRHLSNTWNLLHNQSDKWNGVLIEADTARYQEMKQNYGELLDQNVTCLNTFLSLDGANTLDQVLKNQAPAQCPRELDLLSIDVDGADYHIWNELRDFTSKVVCIEFNPTIPNHVVYVQARSTSIFHGNSLAALVELAKTKHFELVCTTTFNAFFVQKKYFHLFHMDDNSLDKMHDVPMPSEIFQLYDGTLKLTGVKKLIWKKLPIHEKDLQVVPAHQRAFPFAPQDNDLIQLSDQYVEHHCKPQQRQDFGFFLANAQQAFGKFAHQDVRRVATMALQFAPAYQPVEEKHQHRDAIVQFFRQCFATLLEQNAPLEASKWIKAALYVQANCSNQERVELMQLLGESLCRARKWTKAEFWLCSALAIDNRHLATLKSLAKVYTKMRNETATQEVLSRLRDVLQASPSPNATTR